jgi:hypothetical protein
MSVLYFAYGSNLDEVQMRRRCPQAVLVGPARLLGHRLVFSGWWPGRSAAASTATATASAARSGTSPADEFLLLDKAREAPESEQRTPMDGAEMPA